MAVPPVVKEILNSAGMDEILTNALQHDNWKDNSIPVYEKDQSHFPDDLPDKLTWTQMILIHFLTFLAR